MEWTPSGEYDFPSGIRSITLLPLGCHICILLVFFSIDMDMTSHIANVNSICRSQSKGCVAFETATLIKASGSGSSPIKYIPQGAYPIDLINGRQLELAPPREPLAGVVPCSPYKRRWMCWFVYEYHSSKRSLGPLWTWRPCSCSPSFFLSLRILMFCQGSAT